MPHLNLTERCLAAAEHAPTRRVRNARSGDQDMRRAKAFKLAAQGMAAAAALGAHGSAGAQEPSPLSMEAAYTIDVAGPLRGGVSQAGRALDNLDLIGELDLERTAGWRGARAHVYVLVNNGGAPNDLAGTLQGVDNIEVPRAGARLYEAWIEQKVGGEATLLAGLYDLNSEFYATEASGLLLAPPFGIGSELAATGANGPSIFPSTALAVRLRIGGPEGYVQAAAFNATAGVPGDPGGVDTRFDDGVLLIGQAGLPIGGWALSAGAWRYSERQEDLVDLTPTGDPVRRTAQGGYVLAQRAFDLGDIQGAAFLRAGVSDGRTSPFAGGFQGGLTLNGVAGGRPESAFSVGVHQGIVSDAFRTVQRLDGQTPSRHETALELTYSDQLAPWLTIQPDLQVVWRPGGLKDAETAVIAGLRLTVSYVGP